ncbi:MAG: DUF819 family protein [Phycisphaerae bacterium]|nr:DUF819 family protein [Phycisphaerae bacterium]
MMIVGLAFVASWISYAGGKALYGITERNVTHVAQTTLAKPDVIEAMPVMKLVRGINSTIKASPSLTKKVPFEDLSRYNACRLADAMPWAPIGNLAFERFPDAVNSVARPLLVDAGGVNTLSDYEAGLLIDAARKARPNALDHLSGGQMLNFRLAKFLSGSINAGTWKYILVTTIGVLLSFTRMRNLEGAGASKIGSVMLYLLVACIGASANFREVFEFKGVFIMGFIWMSMHVIFMLGVGYLIKAPIFFVAVGSQSNIGGAASAPVVAAAYHPSLAPVGALLAVLGYVLGTYAGLLCMSMLKAVAGAT